MKNWKLTSLALISIIVLMFSACGKSGNETAVLELFSTKGENAQTLQKLADEFMQQKDGKVTITVNSPADAQTVLRSRLTKNDIPDIIAVGGDATYTEMESNGILMDLSSEPFISNIQESYLDMLYAVNENQEQKAYAAPYATNGSGIIYNKDLFEKAGVEVPHTWSDLQDAVAKLEEAGIQPFELTFLDAWTCLPPWNSMAPVLQPENFTQDRKEGKTAFVGTHEIVLQKYLKILENCAGSDFMGTSYNDGNRDFAEGKAAMMINGNWAIPEIVKVNPDINIDMFAFPSTDDPSKNTVTSGIDVALAIAADTKYPEIAKEFLSFMLETQNAQQYVDEQFAFSAVKGAEQNDPSVAGCKEDIAAGKVSNFPDHYYPSGFDLASIISQFALNYVNGMDDAQNITETLQACDQQYDAVNTYAN